MNESAVERLEHGPLAPTLALIDALQSKDALAPLLAALHLETGDSGFFFTFGSNQDYADSNRVIAFALAGGLGMPDDGEASSLPDLVIRAT
jgi:putative endopeptidase